MHYCGKFSIMYIFKRPARYLIYTNLSCRMFLFAFIKNTKKVTRNLFFSNVKKLSRHEYKNISKKFRKKLVRNALFNLLFSVARTFMNLLFPSMHFIAYRPFYFSRSLKLHKKYVTESIFFELFSKICEGKIL